MTNRSPRTALMATWSLLALAGCTAEQATSGALPSGPKPPVIQVSGGPMVEGMSFGVLRKSHDLTAFEMAVEPVSWGDYEACVGAGACKSPALDCITEVAPQEAATPAVCVGVAQAARYCEWIGGRLPTAPEWLAAARGAQPERYPWGNTRATCEQHGRAAGCEPSLGIGAHQPGVSAAGVQDVLLSPGELVAPIANSTFAACAPPNRGCVVHGAEPGSIDAVEPARRGDAPLGTQYGFRCAWDGGAP